MPWPVKSVQRALRDVGMRKSERGNKNPHELWIGLNGGQVELAKRCNGVPHLFLHVVAGTLENQGICSSRRFKRLVREK
jgi:hypothetical protein